MKKIILALGILLGVSRLHAAGQPITDYGYEFSTATTITVTTTPVLLVSTGTQFQSQNWFNAGASTNSLYLQNRHYLEIRNDSANSIWMGVTPQVSTITCQFCTNTGIQIATQTARIDYDSWANYWIVAGTTTFPVTVIQKR